jgi:hypothetical protein
MSEGQAAEQIQALPEINPDTYEAIDRWAAVLDSAPKMDKRATFEAAAADLCEKAQSETNLGAYQSILNDIRTLGTFHAGLADDDVDYILIAARTAAEMKGYELNGRAHTRAPIEETPPPALSRDDYLDDDTSFGPPLDDPPAATDESEYGLDADATTETDTNSGAATETNGISLEDFRAYMPMHNYFYLKSREPWPASSINNRFDPIETVDAAGKPVLTKKGKPKTMPASQWLDQNRPVEQMTWAPGEPMLIADRLVSHGGWIRQRGANCLNLYMPPIVVPGAPAQATVWIEHVYRVFPNDAEHIILWLAHRVQRPAEKINHALVLGGPQGIGKDSLLEPLKGAVGPWNFLEVSPTQLLGRFNGFLKAVILRVSEARDLGDVNRYQFYDHMKALTAAPPDVLRVDEKNLREHSIFNVCGIIITTNHKADGVYLTADDRRHFVAWSDLTKDDFTADYWNRLWRFYRDGGAANVAAYLRKLDISKFDPKAPPPKTAAFWDIVNANRAPEDAELADVLDRLGNPNAVTINRIASEAPAEFAVFLRDRKNRRQIPHRLEACGYTPVRNPAATDGLWKLGGARQVIYAKKELTERDRQAAARRLPGDT